VNCKETIGVALFDRQKHLFISYVSSVNAPYSVLNASFDYDQNGGKRSQTTIAAGSRSALRSPDYLTDRTSGTSVRFFDDEKCADVLANAVAAQPGSTGSSKLRCIGARQNSWARRRGARSVAWKLLNIWLQFVGQYAEIWNA
jgi:hypothetical protein